MTPILFTRKARQEFDEAKDWYESQQAGLGKRFVDRIQEVLDRISANPKLHGIVKKNVRKAVVTQFPYCVYYREEKGRLRIIAVFHTKRDPEVWQSRT